MELVHPPQSPKKRRLFGIPNKLTKAADRLRGGHTVPESTKAPRSPIPESFTLPRSPTIPKSPTLSRTATFTRDSRTRFAHTKEGKQDLALLAMSFLLQDNAPLRELITLLVKIHHDERGGEQIASVLETSAHFCVLLAGLAEDDSQQFAAVDAIGRFHQVMLRFDSRHPEPVRVDEMRQAVENEIHELMVLYPSLDPTGTNQTKSPSTDLISCVLDVSLTILDVFKDAAELMPVPFVKPLIGGIAGLVSAVQRTRSNRDQMASISVVACEFVLALAEACSDEHLAPGVERSIRVFERELHDIVADCIELSNESVISCYLQNGTHRSKLDGLARQLDTAVQKFQASSLVTLHVEFNRLREHFDYTALDGLPKHPTTGLKRDDYLESSREDSMRSICTWIEEGKETVFWIEGAAGMGKSTLAYHVVDHLHSIHRLAGAVFLSASSLAESPPETVIQILACELGKCHNATIPAIVHAIHTMHGVPPIEDYLHKYIFDPIRSLGHLYPLVIVIDALDEWKHNRTFLRHLKSSDPNLVKFVITSRQSPTSSLNNSLSGTNFSVHRLPQASEDVLARYFRWRFDAEAVEWDLGVEPTQTEVHLLAQKADGLFVWAATAASLILSPPMGKRSRQVLQEILREPYTSDTQASHLRLTSLYHNAIQRLFHSPTEQSQLGDYLATTLVLREPISLSEFIILNGHRIEPSLAMDIRSKLKALQTKPRHSLVINDIESDTTISPASSLFHLSFIEHVQCKVIETSTTYAVSLTGAHSRIGEQCLRLLFRGLLPSACQDITDLVHQLHGARLYAVKFWMHHVSRGTDRSPASWSLTKHHSILGPVPPEALAEWALLFHSVQCRQTHQNQRHQSATLPGLDEEEASAQGPSEEHDDPGVDSVQVRCSDVMKEAVSVLQDALGSTDNFVLDCMEIQVRLDYTDETLTQLAVSYRRRFDSTRSESDLQETIALYQAILKLRPNPHPCRSQTLNSLAWALWERFYQAGCPMDLDESISLHRAALALRPLPHPDRSRSLEGLATALASRFDDSHNASHLDLDEAISLHNEALDIQPNHRPSIIPNLASDLHARFKLTGSRSDLDRAISLHREVLQNRPAPRHVGRPLALNNLALTLHTRYEYFGTLSDMDEAIRLYDEALNLQPLVNANDPIRSSILNNFGNALNARFKETRSEKDLNDAIALIQESLDLRPAPHVYRSWSLNNLGSALESRFTLTDNLPDINGSISLLQEALNLRPAPNPERSTSLRNLVNALYLRFKKTRTNVDLDLAISLAREALALEGVPRPRRLALLRSLAFCLRTRFELLGIRSDAQEAEALLNEHPV